MPAAGVAHRVPSTLTPAVFNRRHARTTGHHHSESRDHAGEPGSEQRIPCPVHQPVHRIPPEKEHLMPLIEREKKETFRTIPIKLEEGLAERFLAYAEFLESSKDHVVSAALTYIIGHDKDFTAHLTANGALPGKPGRPRKTVSEANGKAGS
jgi:hypothetical protein